MVYFKICFFTSWMDSSGESRNTCFFVNYKRGLTLPKLDPLFFRIFRQRYGKSDNKKEIDRARLEIKIPSLQKNPISLYSKYEL